ncbi:MAG: NAD(P)-dependent oxidoreductase [Longimicrobiales bacterium]
MKVIVAPHFRAMDEIFRPETLLRLQNLAEVVWATNGPVPEDEFKHHISDADAVVFGTWEYGDALAGAGTNLRALLEVAGGHSHHDLDYQQCFDKGIQVGSASPAFGPAVAEMALGLTLASLRGIAGNDRDFRSGRERWLHDGNEDSRTLFGTTVAFIGCGSLSVSLQRLLEPFGVTIIGYDPFVPDEELQDRGVTPAEIGECFGAEVIYVLAVPSASSVGMLNRDLLKGLDADQTLVVMSRASLLDFDALTELAGAGRFGLAVDVFPEEPLPLSHPLREADGVVLSSHRAGALPEALLAIGDMVVDDLALILDGDTGQHLQYLTPGNAEGLVRPR